MGKPFLEQNRPSKVKEIFAALERDHPDMPAEMKARIAARRGKKNAMSRKSPKHGGPKYKAPITTKWKEKKAAGIKERLLTAAIQAPTGALGFMATAPEELRTPEFAAKALAGGALGGFIFPPMKATPVQKALLGTTAGTLAGGITRIPKVRKSVQEKLEKQKGRMKTAGMSDEIRDPRLYSNLRGMLTLESPEERVAAHKKLSKSKGEILHAMRTGWMRKNAAIKLPKFSLNVTGVGNATTGLTTIHKQSQRGSKGRKEKLAHALDVTWAIHGMPEGIEKNAAAMYFEELRQEERNQDAFGPEFCKLASSFQRDPWVLAQEVENHIDAFEILAKTASDPRTRDLAAYYVEWANEIEKQAGLALMGRLAGGAARGVAAAGRGVATAGRAAVRGGRAAVGGARSAGRAAVAAPGRAARAVGKRVSTGYGIGRHGSTQAAQAAKTTQQAATQKATAEASRKATLKANRAAQPAAQPRNLPDPAAIRAQNLQKAQARTASRGPTRNQARRSAADAERARRAGSQPAARATQPAAQTTQQTGQAVQKTTQPATGGAVQPQGAAAGAEAGAAQASGAAAAAPFGGMNPAHIALGGGIVGGTGYLGYKAMNSPTSQTYQGGGYR